jgi:hypothetical protein
VLNDAKFVPFAGYEMPMQYSLGVVREHLHTRTAVVTGRDFIIRDGIWMIRIHAEQQDAQVFRASRVNPFVDMSATNVKSAT